MINQSKMLDKSPQACHNMILNDERLTMEYRRHEDIPAKYRRIILDETLSKRVSKIPLTTCNEIIKEHLEEEEVMESLRDFEVIIVKNGKKVVMRSKDPGSALAELDKAIGYLEKDVSVVAVLRQAGRLIKAYVKGQWVYGRVSIYD